MQCRYCGVQLYGVWRTAHSAWRILQRGGRVAQDHEAAVTKEQATVASVAGGPSVPRGPGYREGEGCSDCTRLSVRQTPRLTCGTGGFHTQTLHIPASHYLCAPFLPSTCTSRRGVPPAARVAAARGSRAESEYTQLVLMVADALSKVRLSAIHSKR